MNPKILAALKGRLGFGINLTETVDLVNSDCFGRVLENLGSQKENVCLVHEPKTLDAISTLGLRNGAAVSEVRITSDGPVLSETGAWLNGPAMDRQPYPDAGLKGTQAGVFAKSLIDRDRFSEIARNKVCYKPHRAIAKSFLSLTGRPSCKMAMALSC